MSYIRKGDIMIHSMDISQLPSNSRSGSNTNHYDSMEASVCESNEHYATLGRQHRNTTRGCGSPHSERSNTNASHIPYTRYIRPCNNVHELNGQNSVSKLNTETDLNSFPTELPTRNKRRRDRSKNRKRKVIFTFVCGLVIGLIISSVVWLTVDRLKGNKITCEFNYKPNSEININEGSSTKKTLDSSTQSHVTITDGLGKTSVASVLSSLTTKHNGRSNSVPVSSLFTKTTLTKTSVSPSYQLNSRMYASTELKTDVTTKAKLSTLFTSTSTDSVSTSNPTSAPQSSSEEGNSISQATIDPSDKTKEPSSSRLSVSSTTQLFPRASFVASSTNMRDQTTLSSQSGTQASDKSSMTSHDSDTLSSKQTTENRSNQTTTFSSNITTHQSILTTHYSSSTYSSPSVLSASTPVSTSASMLVSTSASTPVSTPVLTSASTPVSTSASTPVSTSASTPVLKSASTPVSTSASTSASIRENVGKRSVQGGHVYVRWGSMSCNGPSELMYKGYVAGGHYQHQGGSTNTICLPEVPTWGNYSDNLDTDRALVYGTEYGSTDSSLTEQQMRNKDVPCSVCQATGRLSHVMIPGKSECFSGWALEYKGYLMGSGYIHHSSELICVDSSPDYVTGSGGFKGGKLLYLAEVRTGTLPSPPYINGRELACVVCTL